MNKEVSPLKISFDADPARYQHWNLTLEAPAAWLRLEVNPSGGLRSDYELKLNSYDLGVDIELYDALQRLRFEHPEITCVVVTSAIEKVFCAGANIQMLAGASHHHKVNFCKFTNETRNSIEDASKVSGQRWIAAVNGTAAGGGYELALACDEILLVDDKLSTVSFPEIPLLGVLPGTGGLTRLVDKRLVRRDRADVFATRAEGLKGTQALAWGLVDGVAPRSQFDELVSDRVRAVPLPESKAGARGIEFSALAREESDDGLGYPNLTVRYDRESSAARFTLHAPDRLSSVDLDAMIGSGCEFWPLALCRELDDAMLRMRFNEPELGTWLFSSDGSFEAVVEITEFLWQNRDHWLVNEILHYWKRTFNRMEMSARSLCALVTPPSCFSGILSEILLVCDRVYMLDGPLPGDERASLARVALSEVNEQYFSMSNGLSRLESRFYGRPQELSAARGAVGKELDSSECEDLGLVTFVFDDIDYDDEVRLFLEERASFSPDALTGMEANCRFAGPETMETKIFARLSAWQNWIFQRPNAVGPYGALASYGTGSRPNYDKERI